MNSNENLWWHDAVVYQIYPRSFADTNHDGVGDLPGIINHLDYLEFLGINTIWLSPIYPSPNVDFGYDVSDYCGIHPQFGSMEDFDRLIKAASSRGINIILDLVLNHTSDHHQWFVQSKLSRSNPFHDWYLWKDPAPNGAPPNNWESVFGGKAWTYDEKLDQYYYHMFYKEQPDVNWRNPAVRKAMLDVFRFWVERGVKGFRLDVFNAYFKHKDFPDNPPTLGIRGFDRQRHLYDIDQPEMIPLLTEIRQLLDQNGCYAVGETFLSSAEKAAKYCGDEVLHSTFNFELLKCKWSPLQFSNALKRWYAVIPLDAEVTTVLGNHDTKRLASRYTHNEDDRRMKTIAVFLLTQPGIPFLYYGDEIGMRDIKLPYQAIKDPIGKKYYPVYHGRDGCRSPMQWDETENAGFSDEAPWLPIHANYTYRNVAHQQNQKDSLLNFYRGMIALRKQYTALRYGQPRLLKQSSPHILAYLCEWESQTLLVVLNFSNYPRTFVMEKSMASYVWKPLISTHTYLPVDIDQETWNLQGNEARILIKNSLKPVDIDGK